MPPLQKAPRPGADGAKGRQSREVAQGSLYRLRSSGAAVEPKDHRLVLLPKVQATSGTQVLHGLQGPT